MSEPGGSERRVVPELEATADTGDGPRPFRSIRSIRRTPGLKAGYARALYRIEHGCDRTDCDRERTTTRLDMSPRYGPKGFEHPFCDIHAAEWDAGHRWVAGRWVDEERP